MTDKPTMLTLVQIAEHLGITYGSVRQYRNRAQQARAAGIANQTHLPEPDDSEGRSPMWKQETIDAWNERRPQAGLEARAGRPLRSEVRWTGYNCSSLPIDAPIPAGWARVHHHFFNGDHEYQETIAYQGPLLNRIGDGVRISVNDEDFYAYPSFYEIQYGPET